MNMPGGSNAHLSGINVTPLVDVSLVLVLIFLVSSPFFVKSLIPVELPKASSASAEDQKNITVSVAPGENYSINENTVDKKNLSQELQKQMKDSNISFLLIRADEKSAHGEVQDVMKIGKKLGFQRIAFATYPKG